jgi:hypothetical protein
MTALEATVEIVKSLVVAGGHSTINGHYIILDENERAKFLRGVSEIYHHIEIMQVEQPK